MRIRKLELHGFKSFPDRTTLHFGSGIACVVGPNGCGKSNIVDAIKWCVGEQSAKSLRGDDMVDVIFAGSSERPPVGWAEVSLTFTTEGGEPLPGEYSRFTEVSIGRRLHRNGTSEYLINQTRVRRRDVVDLFLDTGVGNNLYSFIEQGRIGEIIHASPEKRRGLIDEAAGISRYKARRDEAQQRLEATAAQLDRAADVADEMGRRVRVLEGQVLRAARFRRLRALIRLDEIVLALVKYADLAAARRDLHAALRESRMGAGAADREATRREGEVSAKREDLERAELAATAARDELAEAEANARELEGARTFLARSRAENEEETARAEAARAVAEAEAAEAQAESARLVEQSGALSAELGTARQRAEGAREQLSGAEARRRASRSEVDAREQEAAALAQAAAVEGARADELVRRLGALPAARDRAKQAQEAANRELHTLVERGRKLNAAAEARRAELAKAKAAALAAQEQAERSGAAEQAARARVAEAEGRVEAVRQQGDAAISAANVAVTQAERAGRESVLAAERDLAARAQRAQSEAEAKIRAEQDAARAAVAAAEKQAGDALTAAERREAAEIEALSKRLAEEDGAADAALTAALEAEERAGREAVARAEAESTGKAKAQVEARVAEREAARADVDRLVAGLSALDDRIAKAMREQQEVDGKRRGLEVEVAEEQARERGAAAVREALPEARPLVEHLDLAEADEAWVGAVLDDRLLAPVLATADQILSAASAARKAGRTTVMWVPDPVAVDALLKPVAVLDTLEAALAHHASTGGAAVVRATGERVEGDGLVRLGQAGGTATAALKRRREIGALAKRSEELASAIERDRDEREAAAKRLGAARTKLGDADLAVREAERAGREAVDSAVRAAREAARSAVEVRQAEARGEREARRQAREARLAEARRASAARVAEAAAASREALRGAREAADARIDEVRRASAGAGERVREAGQGDVAAARTAGDEAVERARQRVDAARAEAATRVEEARAALAEARTATDAARKAREKDEGEATGLRSAQFTAEVALARAEGDLHALVAGEERLRARLAELEQQLDAIAREDRELGDAIAASREAALKREADRADLVGRLAVAHGALAAAEREEHAARAALSEAEVALAGLSERVRSTEAAAAAATRRAEEARARRERAVARLAELAAAGKELVARDQQGAADLGSAEQKRAELTAKLQAARDLVAALRKASRDAEAGHKAAVDKRDAGARELADLELRVRTVQVEIDGLRDRMEERYQISLSGYLDHLDSRGALRLDPDDSVRQPLEVAGERIDRVEAVVVTPKMLEDADGVQDRVAAIEENRRALAELGEVNLAAIDEYRDVIGRYGDLATQRADLEASVESIRGAIAKMNKTCRERFREAFDRVNANFQAAYPRLVGGGSARLALTDEEDLLETGVDIFVQPPGKRLQNLSLLSGGEKAMAAIALLLSLFQVKPSPFCLLDEVDAPLDEANGSRFNEMLKEMSGMSQFIVITHNRKTMEAADTLYGITMPTPGVSRLVSVRIGA